MTTNTGIYHWKLGDISLARICKKVYAKVQVVKNEKGLFHDEKGISADESGLKITRELCYYVEIIRTKHRLWLPYTCMHLAARSRPFYGPAIKETITKPIIKSAPRKRKIIEDHILPLNVKPLKHKVPDLNVLYEIRQMPLRQSKYENAFKEFVRLGKEQLFDYFYENFCLEDNGDIIDYLQNVDASTEDKFEVVIKNMVTEKEIDNYLHQCWRYNYVHKQVDTKDNSEYSKSSSSNKQPITVHISWCLVCGEADKLRECTNCPSSFHLACRREWLVSIIHRKKPPKKAPRATLVEKILSSTRTIYSVHKEKESLDLCPSCMWGPKVGYYNGTGIAGSQGGGVKSVAAITGYARAKYQVHLMGQWIYPWTRAIKFMTCLPKKGYLFITNLFSFMITHIHSYDDIVWHKLGSCPWWPARVLTPGTLPSCLLSRSHSPHQWPLKYYGTLNHSWGDSSRMCLFLPKHTRALEAKDDTLRQAVLDASDDYIAVYLT